MRKLAAVFMVLTLVVLGTGTGVAFGGTHGSTDHGPKQRTRHVHVVGSGRGLITINGAEIVGNAYGTARISSVGRFTFHFRFVCLTADCSTTENTTVYIAANGDTLTVRGPVGPGPDFVEEVIGGTGRFARASGRWTELPATFVYDPSNRLAFSFTSEFVGTLRYGHRGGCSVRR